MSEIRIGSLCSGACTGGLDLAVEEVFSARTVWHVELDPAASRVLEAHWAVPNHHDITETDWTTVEPVDVITAGYPCQPFSHAGDRKGTDDARHIWPSVAEAIRVLRPRYCVFENVAGHRSLGFDRVLCDLAALGFDAWWTSVRASDVGAPHRRERLFILAADASNVGHERGWRTWDGRTGPANHRQSPSDTPSDGRDERRADVGRCGTGGPTGQKLGPWDGAGTAADAERGGRDGRSPVPVGGEVGRATAARSGQDTAPDTDRDGLQGVRRLDTVGRDIDRRSSADTSWGDYEPAIRRWERALGRVAPAPTEVNTRGGQRLSPRFVEWMLGYPAGWVCDVPGITRNDQLKILGNSVVSQQGAHALRRLLAMRESERAA
jgi:DNA (cytosine-5)-methyltransferase 1